MRPGLTFDLCTLETPGPGALGTYSTRVPLAQWRDLPVLADSSAVEWDPDGPRGRSQTDRRRPPAKPLDSNH